jgi:hypothetical protein
MTLRAQDLTVTGPSQLDRDGASRSRPSRSSTSPLCGSRRYGVHVPLPNVPTELACTPVVLWMLICVCTTPTTPRTPADRRKFQ